MCVAPGPGLGGGLGLGSLWITIARNGFLLPSGSSSRNAGGQELGLAHDLRRSQRIALTLSSICVFSMTSHVEVVALLENDGSGPRLVDSD